jgi:hypothetical protein
MKINEIITESVVQGKVTKRQQEATRGLHRYYDEEMANTDYTHYRIMMAAASTDGKTEPEMDGKSWHGKMKTSHPYSEADAEKLKIAYKVAGAKWEDLNHGDMKSGEVTGAVNIQSPVAKPKKNRYGV